MTSTGPRSQDSSRRPRSANKRQNNSPEPLKDRGKLVETSRRAGADLPRAASYTSFPSSDVSSSEPLLTFSEEDLIPSSRKWSHEDPYDSGNAESPDGELVEEPDPLPVSATDPGHKITLSRIVVASDPTVPLAEEAAVVEPPALDHKLAERPRKLARTLSNLSKRTKTVSSGLTTTRVRQDSSPLAVSKHSSSSNRDNTDTSQENGPTGSGTISGLSRKLSVLNKKAKKRDGSPVKTFHPADPGESGDTVPSLPRAFSNISLPSLAKSESAIPAIPPVPRTISTEKLRAAFPQSSRKRDDLWSVFHTLDVDYQKFRSKSSALKTNVVRSSLLPFLKAYARHPSNTSLRAEDLDRRTTTLNKWWTGLLEMLSGRNGQSISGTDRPAILDGISGLMERVEWRTSLSSRTSSDQNDSRASSNHSGSSDSSDALFEPVHRNVHNIFVDNLLAQVVIVVDKMSLKSAPASLVAFCGKSCAYAFMFCPGVADILVRLWDVHPTTLKCVVEGFGMSRTATVKEHSERISATFPACVKSLAFESLRQTLQDLKMQPPLPSGTDHIQWHGYWVGRWSGRDSDLFYVFIKYYHILLAEFLPVDVPREDRACSPGFLLIHCQLMQNLDSTLHRQSTPAVPQDDSFDPTLTFGDLLGPDATASIMPVPPANATRHMAENRLVMLLRDMLSEKNGDSLFSRIFADDFCTVLFSAVRMTSLYDHNACFTLLDFLQEAFVIMVRYEASAPLDQPILDPSFWIEVFTKMVNSHNTMTEIRLYAFLYTIWSTITTHEVWKTNLCMRFLLEENFFYSRFNHWCPMVRAYFMRLICWRIARFDGDASESDISILKTLMYRLNHIWCHYNYLSLKADASDQPRLRPSTTPCNPAPSRRLLIIRTDTPATASFVSFTSRSRSMQSASPAPVISSGPNPNHLMQKLTSTADKAADSSKKRGGLLRTLMSYRGSSEARSDSQSPRPSSQSSTPSQSSASSSRNPSPERAPRASMYEPSAARNARTTHTTLPSTAADEPPSNGTAPTAPPYHGPAFFKFSLELLDRRAILPAIELHAPRVPLAAQMLLQAHHAGRGASMPRTSAARAPVGTVERDSARYAGRALAEWQLVVNECQNFFDRRRKEGVPSARLVETPTLSVEPYRRPA